MVSYMNFNTRTTITVCISGIVLLSIIGGLIFTHSNPQKIQTHHKNLVPKTKNAITANNARSLAHQIGTDVSKQLSENHTNVPNIDSLTVDIETMYTSWMGTDPQLYEQMMEDKSIPRIPETLAILDSRKNFYPDIPTDVWSAMTPDEKIERIWSDPDAFNGRWKTIDLAGLRTGTGWLADEEDQSKSTSSSYAIYQPKDRRAIFYEAMQGKRPAVWIVLPVQFNDGVWIETRVTWVWLDEQRGWIPGMVETLGPDCRFCIPF